MTHELDRNIFRLDAKVERLQRNGGPVVFVTHRAAVVTSNDFHLETSRLVFSRAGNPELVVQSPALGTIESANLHKNACASAVAMLVASVDPAAAGVADGLGVLGRRSGVVDDVGLLGERSGEAAVEVGSFGERRRLRRCRGSDEVARVGLERLC